MYLRDDFAHIVMRKAHTSTFKLLRIFVATLMNISTWCSNLKCLPIKLIINRRLRIFAYQNFDLIKCQVCVVGAEAGGQAGPTLAATAPVLPLLSPTVQVRVCSILRGSPDRIIASN